MQKTSFEGNIWFYPSLAKGQGMEWACDLGGLYLIIYENFKWLSLKFTSSPEADDC